MIARLIEYLKQQSLQFGLEGEAATIAATITAIILCAGLFLLCVSGISACVRRLITLGLELISRRTKTTWDDELCEKKLPLRLAHLIVAVLCVRMTPLFFAGEPTAEKLFLLGGNLYIALAVGGVLFSVMDAAISISDKSGELKGVPVKSFFQAVKLLGGLGIGIWIVSIIFDRSPIYFLSGLGAIMAVIMLVFRDTLLGFTAGIMISANDLVRKKDWIEIPDLHVDGEVKDVSLTTIKVSNWDNTVSSIPAYSLISTSFKNWRAMEESGGRRIKRAINIDMETIHFASEAEIEHWKKIRILRPYLDQKLKEIGEERANLPVGEEASNANARHLTNVGTFRAYCVAYLKASSKIAQNMTMLVRQLNLGPTGLPLEIYVFTNDTRWAVYENIQSDIFDHLLAIMPEFNLRPFQEPSGANLEAFSRGGKSEKPSGEVVK